MKARLQTLAVISVLPIVFLSTAAYMHHRAPAAPGAVTSTLLLIPDSLAANSPAVNEWLDAAEEEGLHLTVIHDSEFLNPLRGSRLNDAVIVPDQVHRICNDALVGALYSFVGAGGKLMLVYDACTYDLNGNFTKGQSRLSDLVGISYALYDQYLTDCIRWSQVWGNARAMNDLDVPPGKVLPAQPDAKAGYRAVSLEKAGTEAATAQEMIFRRYQYGDVEYPSFRTEGRYTGTELLHSTSGVVAGYAPHGAGTVLFANLPLGYLEARTDGLLLHSFLHFFSVRLQHAPYLSSVPDGIGGLVFNWHIDGRAALRYVNALFAQGVFSDGPFSVHFTAGPDVDAPGDGKGMDVEHNPEAQRIIREFLAHGDTIGSHGGWIHNLFGEKLNDTNESTYAPYLVWNRRALQSVSPKPIVEYSAPVGNHPEWVTRWLQQNGFNSYYFVGDSGMGPTRVYRDSNRDGDSVWAFPVMHYGKDASLEEMGFDNLPDAEVEAWLDRVADFTASRRTARLVYTHPIAALRYLAPLKAFLQHAQELKQTGSFRWYTMAELADFLNQRQQVHWNVMAGDQESNSTVLTAQVEAPLSLAHFTWILPRSIYREPRTETGNAAVRADGENWLITAGNCRRLVVRFRNPGAAVQFAKDQEQ